MALCAFAALVRLSLAQTDDDVHRVLIVYETDSTQPAIVEIAEGLHHGLDDRNPTKFEVYSEYLDSVRFPGPENLQRMATLLAEKYQPATFEVAIAVGPNAFKFMLDNRNRVAPGVPLMFGAVSAESVRAMTLPPDVKGVVSDYDIERTMDMARRLQPDARRAVVVFGSAPFDRRWEATARSKLGDRYRDFDVSYLTDQTLEGFADTLKRLPRDTAVLLLTIYQDAGNRSFVPREAAAKIAPGSAAPVYSVYDTFLGRGIVGGYMGTFQDVGEQLSALVMRQIQGDATLPQITPLVARPIADWHEMLRFGLDTDLLPPDTEIRFRDLSLWDTHRTLISIAAAVMVLQAGLIGALIVQGRRRRKAEAEAAAQQLELAHLSRASLLGELSGAFAHELNQPLTSILANAEVAKRLLEDSEPDIAELAEILSDIVADDKRAAEVISQLRRLLVKGEASLEPVDLNQAVAATLTLAGSELLSRQTTVDFRSTPNDVPVLGNFAQLQQVVLNLIMNAADATAQLPAPARKVEAVVRRNGRFCELSVTDNGHGLTTEMMVNAFKPFVTSKTSGLGLGLAICRSIAAAHGGTLQFDSSHIQGARIVLTLPLRGPAR